MPKLNIYVDDELFKRIKELRLPMSEISRDALWAAIEQDETAVCQECGSTADYHVRRESGSVYACADHIVLYMSELCTVRPI